MVVIDATDYFERYYQLRRQRRYSKSDAGHTAATLRRPVLYRTGEERRRNRRASARAWAIHDAYRVIG